MNTAKTARCRSCLGGNRISEFLNALKLFCLHFYKPALAFLQTQKKNKEINKTKLNHCILAFLTALSV